MDIHAICLQNSLQDISQYIGIYHLSQISKVQSLTDHLCKCPLSQDFLIKIAGIEGQSGNKNTCAWRESIFSIISLSEHFYTFTFTSFTVQPLN